MAEQSRAINQRLLASLPESARCPTCRYSLKGLTESRCPECGTAFDPASVVPLRKTFSALDEIGWFILAVGVWFVLFFVTFFVLNIAIENYDYGLFSFLTAFTVGWAGREWLVKNPPYRHLGLFFRSLSRGVFVILFVVSMIVLIPLNSYQCPHGTFVGLGPVGIAHSNCGGPCRNRHPLLRSVHVLGDWYFCY
jgi:hypothetical protein